MLLPDDDSLGRIVRFKHRLDLPSGELLPDGGTEGPHITIRYWRPEGDVPGLLFDYLAERLDNETIRCKATGWDILGEDTLALVIESPQLMKLQAEVDGVMQKRFGVPPSDYPEYRPHISVAEGANSVPEVLPNLDLNMTRWNFTEGTNGDYTEVWHLRAAQWHAERDALARFLSRI